MSSISWHGSSNKFVDNENQYQFHFENENQNHSQFEIWNVKSNPHVDPNIVRLSPDAPRARSQSTCHPIVPRVPGFLIDSSLSVMMVGNM